MTHVNYAIEVAYYCEENFDNHDFETLRRLAGEQEFLTLALEKAKAQGNQKIIDRINWFFKEYEREPMGFLDRAYEVIDRNRKPIAEFLATLGTARQIIAEAYGMAESDLFNDPSEYLGGIELASGHKIAYGLGATFIVEKNSSEDRGGHTYIVSKKALREVKARGGLAERTLTIKHCNRIVAVTESEAKRLGKSEIPCDWYQKAHG